MHRKEIEMTTTPVRYVWLIGALSLTVPSFAADQNALQLLSIRKIMFNGTPPLCTQHIEAAERTEHQVYAEDFKALRHNALESIQVRHNGVQADLDTSYYNSDFGQQDVDNYASARNMLKDAHHIIHALMGKYDSSSVCVTTQDILRCAQWAKTITQQTKDSIKLVFHNEATVTLSSRSDDPHGVIGHILQQHEAIERNDYAPQKRKTIKKNLEEISTQSRNFLASSGGPYNFYLGEEFSEELSYEEDVEPSQEDTAEKNPKKPELVIADDSEKKTKA